MKKSIQKKVICESCGHKMKMKEGIWKCGYCKFKISDRLIKLKTGEVIEENDNSR